MSRRNRSRREHWFPLLNGTRSGRGESNPQKIPVAGWLIAAGSAGLLAVTGGAVCRGFSRMFDEGDEPGMVEWFATVLDWMAVFGEESA